MKKSKKLHDSVAVLYQALKPPVINDVVKPMKLGGYSDSGADIAYVLRNNNIDVITPVDNPNVSSDLDWVFPDTKEGISSAISKGVNIIWANTILFKNHPLAEIASKRDNIKFVGQHPNQVHKYDDKWVTNSLLRNYNLPVASSFLVDNVRNLDDINLEFPLIIKPVRGRGSEGVEMILTFDELFNKVKNLLSTNKYGKNIIVEEYLSGEEITVSVMPPGNYIINNNSVNKYDYWTLPLVKRFNHHNGITPCNGIVAIMENSKLLGKQEIEKDKYQVLINNCVKVAKVIKPLSVIRIDCRENETESKFKLFDVNMKPSMTGPGRVGRENQANLVALAASGIGWDYPEFLTNILSLANPCKILIAEEGKVDDHRKEFKAQMEVPSKNN